MKKITFLIALCLPFLGFSQKQAIATEKATYNSSLWAKRLYDLRWLEGSDNYLYYKDGNFVIFDRKRNGRD